MSTEAPPIESSIFNQSFFDGTDDGTGITETYLAANYLKFPTAQSATETINSLTATTLTATNDATINGLTVGKGTSSQLYNTAFGLGALLNNSAIALVNHNTAIGYDALTANTLGSYNTAVGSGALSASTIGSNNTAVGYLALDLNTDGNNNTSFGTSALTANTSGSTNTAVGVASLASNNTGGNNTAVGYQAGQAGTANTTGSNNTYVGYQAQADANNYSNSTALGAGAVITASNQIVLGTASETVIIPGTSLVTTNDATINTISVGKGSTDTSTNVVLGYQSLTLIENNGGDPNNALYNIAIGYQTLAALTFGYKNIAIGAGALSKLSILFNNVAVGTAAGGNAVGGSNVAIGDNALLGSSVTTSNGNFNTAVGSGALSSNTTGTNNTALGANAGNAGTANTTGSNNTYVGYQAQANGSGYSTSTALGAGAIITASNQVVLGTTTETVVIPRITRFLSPPVYSRTNTANQNINTIADTTVLFTSLVSGSSTYTGITYSAGTFTNSNSYSIAVNVSCFIVYTGNSNGQRGLLIQPSGGAAKQGVVTYTTVGTSIACLNNSANIIMTSGSTFTIVTFHTSSTSPLALTSLSGGFSTITIMVF
jgi:hypothetical protein